MADATAQAKEQQAKGAEAKAKSVEEAYAHQGKPTPTQEECDLAKLGVALEEHEDDGSGPSPQIKTVITRQSEAKKPEGSGNYQTRTATPARETKEPAKPQS
jgi:hypothetical protein